MVYGSGNKITPFKGRKIKMDKPVEVYRNLNRKGRVFSIRQNGLVVGHTTNLMLTDVKFYVNKSASKRVKERQKRYVHAWIIGMVCVNNICGLNATNIEYNNDRFQYYVTYNPYKNCDFLAHSNVDLNMEPIKAKKALAVAFTSNGVLASNVE